MPAWNAGQYIHKAILSVLSQDYNNFELVICDDSSTDNTKDIIKEFAEEDPRVLLVENRYSKGAAGARNSALDVARGEFIAFLDADDIWLPGKLTLQIKFMEKENIDFSYSYYSLMSNNRCIKAPLTCSLNLLYMYNPIGCLTVIYNANRIGKITQPNIKSRNDYALWLKIFKLGASNKCIPENLAVYNNLTSGISSSVKNNLVYYYKVLNEHERLAWHKSFTYTLTFLFMNILKKKLLRIYNVMQRLLF